MINLETGIKVFTMVWAAFGALRWLGYYFEFKNLPSCRPGLLELMLLMLAGPLPSLLRYFEE